MVVERVDGPLGQLSRRQRLQSWGVGVLAVAVGRVDRSSRSHQVPRGLHRLLARVVLVGEDRAVEGDVETDRVVTNQNDTTAAAAGLGALALAGGGLVVARRARR